MIITTTSNIDGKQIKDYKGIVFGEIALGMGFAKDWTASLDNLFGRRSDTYERELINAREDALKEMAERAADMGGNAVVGVKVDYETFATGMLMVIACGTAVYVE